MVITVMGGGNVFTGFVSTNVIDIKVMINNRIEKLKNYEVDNDVL